MLTYPIYSHYGYNVDDNNIYHIKLNKIVNQIKNENGYCNNNVSDDEGNRAFVRSHRFIWECCNDIIQKGYEIDHIDKNKSNNNIDN